MVHSRSSRLQGSCKENCGCLHILGCDSLDIMDLQAHSAVAPAQPGKLVIEGTLTLNAANLEACVVLSALAQLDSS